MNLESKKLLLLSGARNMKEILDAAHDMKVKVGVTDWYDVKQSPVKLMADEYFDVSIEDLDALEQLMKTHSYDGVLTGYTDSYLLPYAKLCERMGLPCYGTPEQFSILTDKSRYKELFVKYGVPSLPSYDENEIDENFRDYPLILKPIKGSGGKGLVQVRNFKEFSEVIDQNKRIENESLNYIIEPYISERKELTAFFLFINGEVYLTGTANRFLSKPQGEHIALPMLYSMPSSYDKIFRELTAPPMVEMFRDLGLQNGMLFAQCIIHEGIPKVYDIGYRLTGTLEYKLQDEMYSFNPLKMMINHSLSGSMHYKDINIEKMMMQPGYGFNVTILGEEGIISKIEGEQQILAIPEVIDCAFKLIEEEEITSTMLGTLGQIIARIFFVTNTIEEAISVLEKIYSYIRVSSKKGDDMILDVYTPQLLKAEYSTK